jgi:hypothetical protein
MPVAGWYQDPQEPKRLRWWDGQRWGLHAPEPTAVGPVVPSAPQYPWMQAQPAPGQYPADRPMTQSPTWGFSVPPLGAQPHYPQQSYPQQPYPAHMQTPSSGRAARIERDRAVRALNPLGYAGLVLALVAFLFDPLSIPAVLGIVFGVIGLGRARQLAGHRYTGFGASVAAIVLGAVAVVLFAWQLVRLVH